MTEREKNGERLAMKISRHRQAKHEAIQYEDVKTAYIKGCEDTAKDAQLTKAKELLAKWVELFKPKGGNIPPTPIQIATEQFLAGDL